MISTKPYEMAVTLDAETGKILDYSSGDKEKVRIKIPKNVDPKNVVVTHNHPPEDGISPIFSIDDIGVACYKGISEIRMATPGYRLSMKPPETGWNRAFYKEKVEPAWEKNLKLEYEKKLELIRQEKLPAKTSNIDVYTKTWEAVVKETGMQYTIEKVGDETPQHPLPADHLNSEVVNGVARASGLGRFKSKGS